MRTRRQHRQLAAWGDEVDARFQAAARERARLDSLTAELAGNLPATKAALVAAARVANDPTRPEVERATARERFAAIQQTARGDYHETLHARERHDASEAAALAHLHSPPAM